MKTPLFFPVTILLTVFLVGLSGCMYTYKKPLSEEEQAKQFIVKEDVATVYVYRSEGFAGSVKVPVRLNGELITQMSARRFIRLELTEGAYVFDSGTPPKSSLSIDLEAGGVYFIWQEIKVGLFSPRSKLHRVNTEKGMNQVRRCQLMKGYF